MPAAPFGPCCLELQDERLLTPTFIRHKLSHYRHERAVVHLDPEKLCSGPGLLSRGRRERSNDGERPVGILAFLIVHLRCSFRFFQKTYISRPDSLDHDLSFRPKTS